MGGILIHAVNFSRSEARRRPTSYWRRYWQ